eukprot:6056338-Prymnesium_polylepis.3
MVWGVERVRSLEAHAHSIREGREPEVSKRQGTVVTLDLRSAHLENVKLGAEAVAVAWADVLRHVAVLRVAVGRVLHRDEVHAREAAARHLRQVDREPQRVILHVDPHVLVILPEGLGDVLD